MPTVISRRCLGRLAVMAALVVLATTSLSGCARTNGLEHKSAAEIQRAAAAAVKAAGSVHVTQVSGPHNQPAHMQPARVDLRVQGDSTTGTFDQQGRQGLRFQLTTIGQDTYLNGDQQALESLGLRQVQHVGDRWVKVRPDQLESFPSFSLDRLVDLIATSDDVAPTVGRAKLDDRAVVVLSVLSQADGDGYAKAYIANTGPAYLLRIEGLLTGEDRMDFTEYGADFHITAPQDAVDLSRTS